MRADHNDRTTTSKPEENKFNQKMREFKVEKVESLSNEQESFCQEDRT